LKTCGLAQSLEGEAEMICRRILVLMLCFLCLSLALVLAGCPQGPGSASIGWVYNADGGQWGFRVFGNEDGDVIAVGDARGSNREEGTVYVRFGADGSILADRIIFDLRNPPGIPTPTATLLSNGDVLLAATTAQGDINDNRLRVLRIDPNGNELWDFHYGDDRFVPTAVAEKSTGKILVAGNQYRGGIPYDVFLLLLASNGDVLAFKRMERSEDQPHFTVVRDATLVGDTFFLVGSNFVEVGRDQFANSLSVVEVGEDLDVLAWTRTTGGVGTPTRIKPVSDGFVVIARFSSRIQLLRTDGVGDVVSTRDDLFTQSNPDESARPYDFIVDSSGDIVMVGEGTTVRYISNFFPQITIRPFIAKFTLDGDKIWERSINVNGVFIYGVTETADGGYATTGAAPGPNGDALNVIRFDRNGNIIN
jgi:hypothetical protein